MKKSQPTYADKMIEKMKSLGVTLRGLEKGTGYSYEHLRKVKNGRPIHSRDVSDKICKALGLDLEEMWEIAKVDKLRARYGEVPKELVPPADDRARKYWTLLTRPEQEEILKIMEGMSRKRALLEKADSQEEIVELIAEASEKLGHMRSETRQRRRAIQ